MLVRRAIEAGRLSVLADGSLDPALVGTAWRKGNAQTAANSSRQNANSDDDAAATVDEALRLFEAQAAAVTERVLNGASYADALRIRESYNALLKQLEYATRAGSLIELSVAQNVLFESFRLQRDSWINWPARVAPLIAADMGIEDIEALADALSNHVRAQLSALGEPSGEGFTTK
ncbi:hypothetical protein [Paraburkholderia adhaesiva]|uniref:hypothetical protein n=1 Tax=Paraburkholderia adhaesiva TaxID=2883244 RepID=UPI001F3FED04|nr:hypothetical protein [Paraburkholderia adhaesiva]